MMGYRIPPSNVKRDDVSLSRHCIGGGALRQPQFSPTRAAGVGDKDVIGPTAIFGRKSPCATRFDLRLDHRTQAAGGVFGFGSVSCAEESVVQQIEDALRPEFDV